MALASTRQSIGLSNVVYSVMDESTDYLNNAPTYGTVYPLVGAKAMEFDPGSSIAREFADDGLFNAADAVGEMKVNFVLASILPEDYARILGYEYANGIIQEKAVKQSPSIAIGFKALRSGNESGNNVYDYVWFPKVKLSKPKSADKTKAASIEFKDVQFEGAVLTLLSNGVHRVRTRSDDPAVAAVTLTNWFTAPLYSNSADLNALNVAVAAATLNLKFTFTKTGGGNVTIAAANCTTSTLPVLKGASAAPLAGTYAVTGAGTASCVVTFTPTVAFGTAYIAGYCTNLIVDQNGVPATPAGAVISY